MTSTSYKVKFYKTEIYQGKKVTSHYARWAVGDKRFKKPFPNEEAAESYRADLRAASNKGEAFSLVDGEPIGWPRQEQQQSFYDFACGYVIDRWPQVSAKQRQNMAEALMWATIAMLPNKTGRPNEELLRCALRRHAFNLHGRNDIPPVYRAVLAWVEQHCRPISELADSDTSRILANKLSTKIDGTTRSVWSQKRNHSVVKTALGRAVEQNLLDANPLAGNKRTPVKKSIAIDKRRVLNGDQARRLFTAAADLPHSGPTMSVFFAVMYYSGLRPEEAVDLRRDQIELPRTDTQWGEFHLTTAAPDVGSEWTTDRQPRDQRGLKQREPGETRPVPIPPRLVEILRHHLASTQPGPENRVFRSHRGGILPAVTCRRTFASARAQAFTAAEASSPVATRIYDLRHACLSRWLNAGVPATQVAEWAGNSVDVLLNIYAKCTTGEEHLYKQRIQTAEDAGRQPA